MKKLLAVSAAMAMALTIAPANAQWTNQYPKLDSHGHQIYLEQENLPILSSGPVYPAASPDGTTLAFAHQGWLWLLDLETRVATRLTNTKDIDARPRWSPDGRQIAFVRDSGTDTAIVIRSISDSAEWTIDTPAIDIDPEFTRDGTALLYASGRSGRLELWRRNLQTGEDTQLTEKSRMRRMPRSLADGSFIYFQGAYPGNQIQHISADGETDRRIYQQGWIALIEPDTHPTENAVVYGIGAGNHVRLAVMDIEKPSLSRWLTPRGEKALFATWSADGKTIYYVKGDEQQQFSLMQIGASGGEPAEVMIERWDYGQDIGNLTVHTRDETGQAAPARLSIIRADGHPVVNPDGPTYVDSQNGPVYFYTEGSTGFSLPEGDYRVVATRGHFSIPVDSTISVHAGETAQTALVIDEIWDGREAGYVSADHHIHLNASGVNDLDLEDILLLMQGEQLDFSAPMAWNLYNRFVDAGKLGQMVSAPDGTAALLSQEVRSDFHGHIGLIGSKNAFHPWFFGPREPVYGNRDLHNGLVIPFAKSENALASYVHPVSGEADPFADLAANELPLELVIDGILTDGIAIELVCQWTSPLGTAEAWYRFLNLGKPMPITSGTDMFTNFYRTPAIGTARSYVPATGSEDELHAVIEQVRDGRGFVTTGPALLFEVDGNEPGDVIASGSRTWSLELASVRPVERVEIVVNGEVVETRKGFAGGGSKAYSGMIDLPEGGWIAARAVGGETGWPIMSFAHFAHSNPLWIGSKGSTNPVAAQSAARDLMKALDYAEKEFVDNYGANIPQGLVARIRAARAKLEPML
ncbi:CehA/McbA family metallohydrolase [Altererythrobacter sp. MF3-039]|uniref:CehA/McbA family metallohydrolase n=1 Tax=Altererythrobacter sp. MF3-039 TaxID=3252901 RepID=UPI00390CB74F